MTFKLIMRKLYTWCNVYRKKVNAKVRNSNRRGSKNEMNMKVLNFMEINKGVVGNWHHLGIEQVSSWLSSLLVIGMCITS